MGRYDSLRRRAKRILREVQDDDPVVFVRVEQRSDGSYYDAETGELLEDVSDEHVFTLNLHRPPGTYAAEVEPQPRAERQTLG